MKAPLLFNLDLIFEQPDQDPAELTTHLIEQLHAEVGQLDYRLFPDGESYLRSITDVHARDCLLVCSLHNPNPKLLPLLFLAELLREMGAARIALVAPYLSYMRQDKRFMAGECVTSRHFARWISQSFDFLVTVDPHLHRYASLDEIYSLPSLVIRSSASVANWIQRKVYQPLIIGPDSESRQWVEEVAQLAQAPFEVLEKTRLSDTEVRVSVPHVERYPDHTPVLIDDIISSGQTLLETLGHLHAAQMPPAVCIATHGLFAANAWQRLKASHTAQLVTCNTVPHPTNQIDLAPALASGLRTWLYPDMRLEPGDQKK